MIYAYIRVSSITQNIDRQLIEMEKLNIPTNNIYIDYVSGKDFNRKNYLNLMSVIKKDDLLIVKSIDRLGRNYQKIVDEWYKINKVIGAEIKVLDMPLLDTTQNDNNLVGRFISDIVLQILSFVAENERQNIKIRQAEGIKIAKSKAVVFGRPKIELPSNFYIAAVKHNKQIITASQAIKLTNMAKSTYYKYYNEYFNNHS